MASTTGDLDCPVCLEIVEAPVTLICGHTGCKPCLIKAVTSNKRCPVCRDPTTVQYVQKLRVNIFIQNMAAPHLKEQRRAEAELQQELDRARAAEEQRRAEKARTKKEAKKARKRAAVEEQQAESRGLEAARSKAKEEASSAAQAQTNQQRRPVLRPTRTGRPALQAWGTALVAAVGICFWLAAAAAAAVGICFSLLAMQVMQLAPASEEVLDPSGMAASLEIDWQLLELLSVSGAENAEDVAVGTAAAFAQAERVRQ